MNEGDIMKKNDIPHGNTTIIKKIKAYEELARQGRSMAEYAYEDDENDTMQNAKLPKAVYQTIIIMVVVVFGLMLWLNRENINKESFSAWIKNSIIGEIGGEGFPVEIVGNRVDSGNFTSKGYEAVLLSDTALTVIDSSGKEVSCVRHSFPTPAMSAAVDVRIIYDSGGRKYILQSGGEVVFSKETENNIITADAAKGGSYAIAVERGSYASGVDVYTAEGKVKYAYNFFDQYITSVSLNPAATMMVVCSASSIAGEVQSRVTVLDLNVTEPVYEFEAKDNLFLETNWSENGVIYVVGDTAAFVFEDSSYKMTEYTYDTKQLTAFYIDKNRMILSVSGYEHKGACVVMAFTGKETPLNIETAERVESISAYAETFAMLGGGKISFYDVVTGKLQGETLASADAKAVALASEKMVYSLGIHDLRITEIK